MIKKLKAAIFTGANKPFEIKEFDITPPKKGMARLDLEASGVCGTDVHFHTGKLLLEPPKVIGHEFVGRVVDISEEDSKKFGINAGDVAIVDIACPCGECKLCKSGDDANCVNMAVTNGGNPYEVPYFHGGFAETTYATIENLIKLPENVDPLAACVFACPGPTAIHAFNLAKKAGVDLSDVSLAVVQGTGPVGCMAIAYLKALNVKKIFALVADITNDNLNLVKKLGADDIIDVKNKSDAEIGELIKNASDGLGADLVFEASGNPKAIPTGFEILRNRGVYLVPGQYSNSGEINIMPQLITFKALHIIGSSQYNICDVKEYVDFIAKDFKLQEIIKSLASCYTVSDINVAFDDAKARKNIKTVLVKEG